RGGRSGGRRSCPWPRRPTGGRQRRCRTWVTRRVRAAHAAGGVAGRGQEKSLRPKAAGTHMLREWSPNFSTPAPRRRQGRWSPRTGDGVPALATRRTRTATFFSGRYLGVSIPERFLVIKVWGRSARRPGPTAGTAVDDALGSRSAQ